MSSLLGAFTSGNYPPWLKPAPQNLPTGPSPMSSPGPGESEQEPLRILDQMIQLAKRYIDVEPDAVDKATMGKLLQTLLQYQAKDQSDADAALGSAGTARILRKSGG